MNPIKFSEFKVQSSFARRIAENLWGTGGTTAQKTTKRGFYYYSCSRHGGYVVDGKHLSDRTKAILKKVPFNSYAGDMKYLSAESIETGEEYVLGTQLPCPLRQISIRYNPNHFHNLKWKEYPAFFFEEDCAWAIATYLEEVELRWAVENHSEVERAKNTLGTMARYYPGILWLDQELREAEKQNPEATVDELLAGIVVPEKSKITFE